MKYGKSAFPYLALLVVLLIGMPIANYQIQKTQRIQIEVKLEHQPKKKSTYAVNNSPKNQYQSHSSLTLSK
ncbi:hypothetical protein OAF63_00785 [Saprospiraceae bacterium]|jgi:hypothetical protein|nr:hypothetical protein [Bacteroidota bacterium]MDB4727298.1 hypothetical protein [Saprospiraceae bacterium]MDF1865900.1 hypothetical protein [Saprospiraceae bacterium]